MILPVIRIREIDHLVLRVRDIDAMRRFYCEVLGAQHVARRPQFGMSHLRLGRSLLALLWHSTNGLAQGDYPNRPLRLIVTVPPGGAADFIARLVGGKLADLLGQPVLVENRAGASGTIAADSVAKAPADGYTLLQNSITTHGLGPHLFATLPY